jgi:hypothetical protein
MRSMLMTLGRNGLRCREGVIARMLPARGNPPMAARGQRRAGAGWGALGGYERRGAYFVIRSPEFVILVS